MGAAADRARIAKILAAVALAEVAVVTAALAARGPTPRGHGLWWVLMLVHVIAYAVAGTAVVVAGWRVPRAAYLGALLVLVASMFAWGVAGVVDVGHSMWRPVLAALSGVRMDMFAAFLVWRFASEFPRVPLAARARRRSGRATSAAAALGVALSVANAIVTWRAGLPPGANWLASVAARLAPRSNAPSLYYPLQFVFIGAALAWMPVRARRAAGDERRRASLLLFGLVAGTAPATLWILFFAAFPATVRLAPLRVTGWVIYPALLSVPFTVAYAVLVRHALDVRVVVRRAIQYALARYSVLAAAAVPAALLLATLHAGRTRVLGDVVATPRVLLLVALSAAGGFVLRGRAGLLARIDRRFFRDQHDTRRALVDLLTRCRDADGRDALTDALATGIRTALHPATLAVLTRDPARGTLVAPDVRPLRLDTVLATRLESGEPLAVDLERDGPESVGLPAPELNWLLDGDFRLLLPLRDAGRRLAAVVALGEKANELPYTAEERALLRSVAAAAEGAPTVRGAMPLLPNDAAPAPSDALERCATECDACAAVLPCDATRCPHCRTPTRPCPLPQLVSGKFLLDQRVGAGGMGVVYHGLDVHLGRSVAIKTLPYLAPAEAARLRREARAVAAVSHPNLAVIYAAESWQGQPLLVFEYLPGGTLADRLRAGPLSPADAIALGCALCTALEAIHGAGVLHRDIKPSNIGFAADGTPKLLDFGLARLIGAATGEPAQAGASWSDDGDAEFSPTRSSADRSVSLLAGTPLYMSPEALLGEPPDAQLDLWAVAVVLYESVAGHHPLAHGQKSRFDFLRPDGGFPDIRTYLPTADASLAAALAAALAADPGARPETAAGLRDVLSRLGTTRQTTTNRPAASTLP